MTMDYVIMSKKGKAEKPFFIKKIHFSLTFFVLYLMFGIDKNLFSRIKSLIKLL